MKRIGIDVGGTFTDVVLLEEDGWVHTTKVPTTPANRVLGAIAGFRRILDIAGCAPGDVGFIGHGSTMATNMVVEGTGAPTALLATRGFRDLLELRRIARHDRADLYDLQFDNPPPLVPRRWRHEVPERLDWRGEVERELDVQAQYAGCVVGDRRIAAIARRGEEVVRVPAKGSHEIVHRGDVVMLQPAGSGGYGDPRGRDRRRLLDDLKDGYITPEALERDYGLSPQEAAALRAEAANG